MTPMTRPLAAALAEQQRRIAAMATEPDNHATPRPMLHQVREHRVRQWAQSLPDAECNCPQFKVIK